MFISSFLNGYAFLLLIFVPLVAAVFILNLRNAISLSGCFHAFSVPFVLSVFRTSYFK